MYALASVSQRVVEARGRRRPRAAGRQYLDLRPALHTLLEGACHGARGALQPGATGGPQATTSMSMFAAWVAGGCGCCGADSAVSIATCRRSSGKEYNTGSGSSNGQRDTAFGQRQHRYVVSVAGVLVR